LKTPRIVPLLFNAVAHDRFAPRFDEHRRHWLVQIFHCRLQHAFTAGRIERDKDGRLTFAETGFRIDDLVTRCDYPALQYLRRLVAAPRVASRPWLIARLIHKPKLQRRRGRQYLVELVGVLHARQLYDDSVDALSLHERLGHTELIDTIAQRRKVLLDGKILTILDLRLGHPNRQRRAVRPIEDENIRIRAFDDFARLLHILGAREANSKQLFIEIDAVTNPGVAKPLVEVLLIQCQAAVERRVHIDFQQNINAATQVETEAHRAKAEVAHPFGQLWCQCRRNIGFARVLPAHAFAGHFLVFGRVESQDDATVLQIRRFRRNAGTLDNTHELIELRLVECGSIIIRDLHCLNAPVDIGQGEQATGHHNDEDQCVEPRRVFVHRNLPLPDQASSYVPFGTTIDTLLF
jgi:hypothetical protein